jgi:hypothetical protein
LRKGLIRGKMANLNCIKKIWPDITNNQLHEEHYRRFVRQLELASSINFGQGTSFATHGLDDTLDLIAHVRGFIHPPNIQTFVGQFTRRELVTKLTQAPNPNWRSSSVDDVSNALCLCTSLWSGLDIRIPAPDNAYVQTIPWDENSTLSTTIESVFPRSPPVPQPQQGVSEPNPVDTRLTMEALCNFHGFRVLFTDNLAEHLQIQWQGVHSSKPLIMIYQHKIFLWNELRFTQTSPLPRQLVEETLDTLNLLFPCHDYHTAKFLRKHGLEDFYGLGWCGRGRQRDLNQYHYWRDRIAELSDVLKGPSLGFQQLRPDRNGRNLMEFLNFWMAAFVGLFTIVSISFGAASIVLAKWQYDLALKQYDLSLAQACSSPNATKELPGFC